MGASISEILYMPDGQHFLFHCPACEIDHVFPLSSDKGETGWTWNRDIMAPTFRPSLIFQYQKLTPEGEKMVERMVPLRPGMKRYPAIDIVCHSYITDGYIRYEPDCTHAMRGQLVKLPPHNRNRHGSSS